MNIFVVLENDMNDGIFLGAFRTRKGAEQYIEENKRYLCIPDTHIKEVELEEEIE